MDAVSSISELYPAAETATGTKNSADELGQDEFMTLMVAQLENQDPTKPMDNFQFLSQIAQFGTVSGIQDLQLGLEGLSSALLSNQAMQAADLVGREVVTDSNVGSLPEEGDMNAELNLAKPASNVTLYVQDAYGGLILAQPMGAVPAGQLNLHWDGTNESGHRMPPGEYRLSAEALIDGQNQAVSVYTRQRVESVTVDQGGTGVQLNLAGGSQIGMSEVKSIF